MRKYDIIKFKEAYGAKGVRHIIQCQLEGVKMPNGVVVTKKPEDFSIRELWEGLVGDVGLTLTNYGKMGAFNYMEIQEAIDSSMFPTVTGMLIAKKVIDAYSAPRFVGDRLVTVMPSKLKVETIAGFSNVQSPKEVLEGADYEESSMGEKFVTTASTKIGRILSITEEAIFFDQTGQLLMRAQRLGETIAQHKEKTILDCVTGVNAGVYRPNGVATTLYSAGNKNLHSANPLVDWTSIQTVLSTHALNMKDDRQGEAGEPIVWMPDVLLTPVALSGIAGRISSATEVRSGSVASEQAIWRNPFLNKFEPVSSAYLDAQAVGTWYLGEFARQFIWQEIFPLQTFQQRADSEMAFQRDVVARFKVRYFGGCNALDHRLVMKIPAS